MSKLLKFNDDARSSIKKGIDKLADAVKMTLGPRGRAVVIEKGYGAPTVTFDGVTVAKEIELEDKFENLGADLIKQAADKTNDNVGDGTTTSIVLAHAMINAGEKAIKEEGFNVIQLADEMKEKAEEVIKGLEKQKEPINDNKKIQEVATLSAKDKEIGHLIAKVMEKIGREGVVSVEDSNTISNSFEVVEGMELDNGYISQYMVSNAERMESVLEDPYILITDKKISSIKEILPILEKVVESGKKDMVIIADDVEGEALTTLVVNKLRGTFNVLAVKAPGFGDRKKEMLADIAIVTGGQFVTEELGKKLDAITLADLGRARRVTATKDKTKLVGGKGAKKDIEARIAELKNQIKNTESGFDKDKLQERLGKLAGGVAVIKVGAPTEAAQKELKQRVDDAVAATRAAMEEGIVPGGGIALFNVGAAKMEATTEAGKAAITILQHALRAPLTAILENSGENAETMIKKMEAARNGSLWFGFNAMTGEMADLKSAGIIDPLKVTKTAFMNALSVASNYLMIGAAVTDVPKPEAPGGGMGGMQGMM